MQETIQTCQYKLCGQLCGFHVFWTWRSIIRVLSSQKNLLSISSHRNLMMESTRSALIKLVWQPHLINVTMFQLLWMILINKFPTRSENKVEFQQTKLLLCIWHCGKVFEKFHLKNKIPLISLQVQLAGSCLVYGTNKQCSQKSIMYPSN